MCRNKYTLLIHYHIGVRRNKIVELIDCKMIHRMLALLTLQNVKVKWGTVKPNFLRKERTLIEE